MVKGRIVYVPPVVMDEVESIKADHDVESNAEAMRKMVKYSQVGREIERIRNLDFLGRRRKK